jgi:hypothetical protein
MKSVELSSDPSLSNDKLETDIEIFRPYNLQIFQEYLQAT